ncbi:MAG: Stp1/IreP family PP2C-type Ser/Thr phosphatase [Waddliaceae bacterium]
MSYKIKSFGLSDIGLTRETNEDAYVISDLNRVYILADGMGGHLAGEVAAKEAVDAFHRSIDSKHLAPLPKDEIVKEITCAIDAANRHVYKMSLSSASLRGMGTTLCSLLFSQEDLFVAHVGDSRVYRLRSGELEQLTEDHSLQREMLEYANFASEQIDELKYKSIITKAIGTQDHVIPSIKRIDFETGDWFLLCSDGLSDYLSHCEMEEILNRSIALDHCACGLIEAAKAKGGQDNITVILLQIEE